VFLHPEYIVIVTRLSTSAWLSENGKRKKDRVAMGVYADSQSCGLL
jgi:hypothetical protein